MDKWHVPIYLISFDLKKLLMIARWLSFFQCSSRSFHVCNFLVFIEVTIQWNHFLFALIFFWRQIMNFLFLIIYFPNGLVNLLTLRTYANIISMFHRTLQKRLFISLISLSLGSWRVSTDS